MEATEAQHSELNFYFTNTEYGFSLDAMAKLKHIIAALGRQTNRKEETVRKAFRELSSLLEAHQRYMELSAHLPQEEESMKIGAALIMAAPLKYDPEGDAYDPKLRDEIERAVYEDQDLPLVPRDLDLLQYPLWKIMREILRQVPEMRVYELETHLQSFGVKAHRMAIESAIAKHPKQFVTRKSGHEKFVAWKESDDAAATKYAGRGRKRRK